jgi:hypothetical protein
MQPKPACEFEDWIRTDAAFAMCSGTAPVPASSGRTYRHRLNRVGDRQLYRAPHIVAVNRMRCHPPTHCLRPARRQDQTRHPPLHQALPRPPPLPGPEQIPGPEQTTELADKTNLTNIGASLVRVNTGAQGIHSYASCQVIDDDEVVSNRPCPYRPGPGTRPLPPPPGWLSWISRCGITARPPAATVSGLLSADAADSEETNPRCDGEPLSA